MNTCFATTFLTHHNLFQLLVKLAPSWSCSWKFLKLFLIKTVKTIFTWSNRQIKGFKSSFLFLQPVGATYISTITSMNWCKTIVMLFKTNKVLVLASLQSLFSERSYLDLSPSDSFVVIITLIGSKEVFKSTDAELLTASFSDTSGLLSVGWNVTNEKKVSGFRFYSIEKRSERNQPEVISLLFSLNLRLYLWKERHVDVVLHNENTVTQ